MDTEQEKSGNVPDPGQIVVVRQRHFVVLDDARQWVAYMIGTGDQQRYIYEIERLKMKDPQVYFAVTVLWKIMTSWIWDLEEYG